MDSEKTKKLQEQLIAACRDMIELSSSYLNAIATACDHAIIFADEILLDAEFLSRVAKELHGKHLLARKFGCDHPRGRVNMQSDEGKEEEE